jgi:N-carbamoylputrescine amidase
MHGAGEVRVACVQMEPRVGQKDANVASTLAKITEAADRGAQLIVLPELCNSGYMFETREEALALAEDAATGPTVRAWGELAAARRLHIVGGVNERDGGTLYNTSVVIGPNGLLGKFRKMHLWNLENVVFTKGNLGFPVFDTPFGRLATVICYDGWFPESYRLCVLQGADLVCVPTNWVPMPDQPLDQPAMANLLVMAAAHANAVFIAAADRIGVERGQAFEGQSLIVAPTGWPIAGPASRDREETLVATLDLGQARRSRRLNEHNDVLRDRRVDLYGAAFDGATLGPSAGPGPG